MNYTERFIQDAFTCGKRMERVLNDPKVRLDWQFESNDLVNQEFSFSSSGIGGRLDIIATFNDRTKALLCEVKSGKVGEAELDQLIWYVENWRNTENTQIAEESVLQISDVCGILLAEDFWSLSEESLAKAKKLRIHFVTFKITDNTFPFRVCSIDELKKAPKDADDQTANTVLKHSRLWKKEDWLTDKCSDKLKDGFDGWSNCFLDTDAHKSWITKIYKGGHIAIHYKGEYILWLKVVPTKDRLDGGFAHSGVMEQHDFSITFSGDNIENPGEHSLEKLKTNLKTITDAIDEKYRDVLPDAFPFETQNQSPS